MKIKLLFILLAFISIDAFGCLNTYQFRVFPIGHDKGQIVTLDYKVYRTSQIEGSRRVDFALDSTKMTDVMWILIGNISHYDYNQQLIKTSTFDTILSLDRFYLTELSISFKKGLKLIKNDYSELDFFEPIDIYFCDYSDSCSIAKITIDTIQGASFIKTHDLNFEITVIKNQDFYGFDNSPYFGNNLKGMNFNSVRTYKSKEFELIVFHTATGMKLKKADENDPIIDFQNIKESYFHEPVLHHEYGIDLFVIKKE